MGFETAKNKKHALDLVRELKFLDDQESIVKVYPKMLNTALASARKARAISVELSLRIDGTFLEFSSNWVGLDSVYAPLSVELKNWDDAWYYIRSIYTLIDETQAALEEKERKEQLAKNARAKLTPEELEALGLK